jgi:hypothetical protein|tara:strand:+ start:1894 stop:2157 length:264 start_codon:yes stop_codon:yes gene_type:complete
MTENEIRHMAKERIAFKIHLATYIPVMTFLWVLNWFTTDDTWWAIWPTMGWGVGLAIHGFNAYFLNEEFLIEAEMDRIRQKQSKKGQ